MSRGTVLKEVLKELDMDIEDVADGAREMLKAGIEVHLQHRHNTSRAKLDDTLRELRDALDPALGGAAGGAAATMAAAGVLPRASRVLVERLVGRALTQLPGVLGTNQEATHSLLSALELVDPDNATAVAGYNITTVYRMH